VELKSEGKGYWMISPSQKTGAGVVLGDGMTSFIVLTRQIQDLTLMFPSSASNIHSIEVCSLLSVW